MTDMAGMLPAVFTHPPESHPLLVHKSAEVMVMASCVPALSGPWLALTPPASNLWLQLADSSSLTDIQSMLPIEECLQIWYCLVFDPS